MREIKVRIKKKGYNGVFFRKDIRDNFHVGEDDIVMQYTGLKDKNGKEIYEGDILEHRHLSDPRTGKPFTEIVKYKSCGFEPFLSDEFIMDWAGEEELKRANSYYIVGNIFDNPELTKKGETKNEATKNNN